MPSIAIFGMGHVGLELARILARHDLDLHLVDSRKSYVAADRLACLDDGPAEVIAHHSPVPELALGEVPSGTHVLILTHDHAEDFALCDAALRTSHLGSVGLIGSAAKWRRFQQGLRVEGHAESTIARIQSPIGTPEIPGKDPAVIALSVASQLLRCGPGRRRAVMTTIYRARVVDTPEDPFTGGVLRSADDAGLAVVEGVITARGDFAAVRADHPDAEVVDLRGGVLLPGLVDTHVHYPQVRAIGALGMPLLEWLERCALPEELRLESVDYAREVAAEFVFGLVSAGTTTSLVFGSHFAPAVDALFTEAARVGVRVTSGLVVSDRGLPEPLLTTPERAYEEALALAGRWHGVGRARYAVTPRFSFSTADEMLDACASVTKDVAGTWFTTHVNENTTEVAEVARLFVGALHYVDTYDRHGLVGERSVLAHNVHASDQELAVLAGRGAGVAHCPTSNSALGSGLFPLRRHVEHGVRVALGSDVGAGTGFSLFKEGLQAYFMQSLLGPEGIPLTATHLLHLATRAGALALGLGHEVGDLSVGKQFDAVWVRPLADDPLDVGLRHAASAEDAVAKIFALGGDSDLAGVWVGGDRIKR